MIRMKIVRSFQCYSMHHGCAVLMDVCWFMQYVSFLLCACFCVCCVFLELSIFCLEFVNSLLLLPGKTHVPSK